MFRNVLSEELASRSPDNHQNLNDPGDPDDPDHFQVIYENQCFLASCYLIQITLDLFCEIFMGAIVILSK